MEEEFADIYYVDSRNAVVDHRSAGTRPRATPWRPTPVVRPRAPMSVPPTRTVYVPQTTQPVYADPMAGYYPPPGSTASMLLGRFTIAQVVEAIGQGIAAMKSLPTAPVATRDAETDITNMVLYQSALADHAKFDERIRTLASVIAKLVG